ncbi:hypothetical protein ACQP2X_25720 [Actinoplanes sp. CA-131856]
MSFDLQLTRVVPAFYSARFPIQEAEVVAYVEQAPDMIMAPWLTPGYPGRFINVDGAGWTRLTDGMVAVKNPDDGVYRRMAAMAAALDAWMLVEWVQFVIVEGDRVSEREVGLADLPHPRYFVARDAPIGADEWAGAVATLDDFVWETRIKARLPSGRKWIACPPVACWTGHPTGELVPFHLDEDEGVDVWQPDALTLDRMRGLAAVLGGWVSDESGRRA